jgi:ankyrin repeat protein
MLMWRRRNSCNCPGPDHCLLTLILLLFLSGITPLHRSAIHGRLEVCRLLVESKADVAARMRCFSPPPSHHLSLTICLAAMAAAELHSKSPSTATKPTLLLTSAASAPRSDALPRLLRPPPNKCSSRSCRRCYWQLPLWGGGPEGGGQMVEVGGGLLLSSGCLSVCPHIMSLLSYFPATNVDESGCEHCRISVGGTPA